MADVPNVDPSGLQHGPCQTCGKRRYLSRRDAKRAARMLHPDAHMQAYRCGDYWHIGRNQFPTRDLARRVQVARTAVNDA